ncbi:MAG: hypothetical protein WC620_01900 [Methanoregula sp.]|jgi:hypothetical protein
MKIGREDFEALIKGEKTIAPYIELDPLAGTYSVFGVKTASNPNYLIKAIYEMYEASLNKKLAVKAVRNLFRSVGAGSVGLNNMLKKQGMELTPAEFLMLVFKMQHQQGWGAPFELVEASEKRSCYGASILLSLMCSRTGTCRYAGSTRDGSKESSLQ